MIKRLVIMGILLILITTVFSEDIASQSVGAMMSRSTIWLIILFLVWRNRTDTLVERQGSS